MGSPNDWHFFLFWLTNRHTCTPEETVCHSPVACCLTVQGLPCRIPKELAKTAWITIATYHTWGIGETGPPEMNFDWSVDINIGFMFVVLLIFSEELASHSQHCQAQIAPTISMSRPNVRAHRRGWVTAWQACETIFQHEIWLILLVVHFDGSRWAVVISLCLWNFHMWITVDCAPVTLWICCHGGYWGMVHWLCIWKPQAKLFIITAVVFKTVIDISVMIRLSNIENITTI